MKNNKILGWIMFLINICITTTNINAFEANSAKMKIRNAYIKQVKKDKKEYKNNNEKKVMPLGI